MVLQLLLEVNSDTLFSLLLKRKVVSFILQYTKLLYIAVSLVNRTVERKKKSEYTELFNVFSVVNFVSLKQLVVKL